MTPSDLEGIPSVRTLDLRDNNVDSLPVEMVRLPLLASDLMSAYSR